MNGWVFCRARRFMNGEIFADCAIYEWIGMFAVISESSHIVTSTEYIRREALASKAQSKQRLIYLIIIPTFSLSIYVNQLFLRAFDFILIVYIFPFALDKIIVVRLASFSHYMLICSVNTYVDFSE